MFNISYNKIIPALFALSLSSAAYAQEKPLDCKLQSSGAWAGCSISQTELFPTADYERTAKIRYKFNCSPGGQNRFPIGITLGENTSMLLFGGEGEANVDGTGSLRLTNGDPNGFYASVFKPGCNLQIESTDLRPSEKQLEVWAASKIALEQDQSYHASAGKMLDKVIVLSPAFELVWELAGKLTDDLQADAKLRTAIAPGSPTRALILQLATSRFALDASSLKPRSLSDAEITALNALLDATESINPTADCTAQSSCTEIVLLKKLGTANSQKVLEFTNWKPELDAFRATAKEAHQRYVEASSALLKLCLVSQSFITWETKPEGCK